MCLHRNVMIMCGVIHPGHPICFSPTVNCICNIEIHEMVCFAKNQQMGFSIIYCNRHTSHIIRSDNYIQRGPFSFLRVLLAIIN